MEEVGRQYQGMDGPGLRQVPEGSGEHGKMETAGCKIICGAPTTLAVKGLMMMMMVTKSNPVSLLAHELQPQQMQHRLNLSKQTKEHSLDDRLSPGTTDRSYRSYKEFQHVLRPG